MKQKVLITGGAGFIGSHIVDYILATTDWDIIIIDRLSYASNGLSRLRAVEAIPNDRVRVFTFDFSTPFEDSRGLIDEIGEVDYILHLGAETHVDNAIKGPRKFVYSNVVGTFELLEYARLFQPNLKRFVYFSTDEVFGPAPEGVFYKEWDRYNSTNPYSATKAAGEELALAYATTYGLPVIITHTMNVFGERQHNEKLIPTVIRNVLAGKTTTIYSNPEKTKSGSRHWIHARNVAAAVLFLLERGEQREKYNIVGEREVDNLDMAQTIAECVGKPLIYEMVDFHTSRPGHDLRYALDGSRMAQMGWVLPSSFEDSLKETVQWYVNNVHQA